MRTLTSKIGFALIACFAMTMSAAASDRTTNDRRETLENGIVQIGDSMAAVRKAGGEPKTKEDIRNLYNAKIGELWTYIYHDHEIRVTFGLDSTVSQLEEDL